eukprot:1643789-Rhodomonas_salina.2
MIILTQLDEYDNNLTSQQSVDVEMSQTETDVADILMCATDSVRKEGLLVYTQLTPASQEPTPLPREDSPYFAVTMEEWQGSQLHINTSQPVGF